MNKELEQNVKRLENILLEKKLLENQEKDLRAAIVAGMTAEGLQEIKTNDGKFTTASRKKWTFSPAVTELEERLDATKKREQQDGTAVAEQGDPYLVYKENKE